MYIGLWGFLSISVTIGVLFVMFLVYIDFKRKQMKLNTDKSEKQEEPFKTKVEKSGLKDVTT